MQMAYKKYGGPVKYEHNMKKASIVIASFACTMRTALLTNRSGPVTTCYLYANTVVIAVG